MYSPNDPRLLHARCIYRVLTDEKQERIVRVFRQTQNCFDGVTDASCKGAAHAKEQPMQRSSPCKGAAHILMWPLLLCLMILDTTVITTPANAWDCCWKLAVCPPNSTCQADCGWGYNCTVMADWTSSGTIQTFKCSNLFNLCTGPGWNGMDCGDPVLSGSCSVSYTPDPADPDCTSDLLQCDLDQCPRSFSSTADCNAPQCGCS
ncbi:MAG: hypothetical protein GEEBNDBF_01551 [bacterium]|nr:hypothetical protein [bacterium]